MTSINTLFILILCILAGPSMAEQNASEPLDTRILKIHSSENVNNEKPQPVLKVGVVIDEYIPFYVKKGISNMEGITADYLSIMEKSLNKHFSIIAFKDKAGALRALQNKEIDLIAGNKSDNNEHTLSSKRYVFNRFVEVKRRGEAYKNAPIIAIANHPFLKKTIPELYGNKEVASFDNALQALQSIAFKRTDLFIGNPTEINFLINQLSLDNLEISDFSLVPEDPFVFLIKSSNPQLLAELNTAIDLIPISSDIEIQQRWQGGPVHYNISKKIKLSATEEKWIKDHPVVKYAAPSDLYPLIFKITENSNPTGIAVDVLKQIENLTGLKFVEAKHSGNHDVVRFPDAESDIIPNLAITAERKKTLLFSSPYIQSLWGIITRLDNKDIRSLNDLAGKRVVIIKNSIAKETILDLNIREKIQFIEAPDLLSTFRMLDQKKADATINNLLSSNAIIFTGELGKFQVIGTTNQTPINIAIAIRKDRPILAEIINKAVLSISQDKLNDIRSDWVNNKSAAVQAGLIQYNHSYYKMIFIALLCGTVIILFFIFIRVYKERKLSKIHKAQLEILSSLIDQLPFALFINLPGQGIEISNRYYKEQINSSHPVTENDSLTTRIAPVIKKALESKSTVYEDISIQVQGRKLDLMLWSKPFLSVSPDSQAILGGWFDISLQKDSERELLKAKNEAETANRAKSTFLAIISHEIRTPMNAILGLIELELKKANNRNLTAIFQSANSLLNLLDGILDQAKIEAGKLSIAPHPCNLYRLLDGIEAVYSPIIKENGLKLFIHLDPQVPDLVLLDEKRLAQVLGNLIGNSIKFTQTGSVSIKLSWQDHPPAQPLLRIEVTDTGSGISYEAQAKIFDAYAQDELSNKTGTGLGLWICANLIKQMDGEISLQSQPDFGTTVFLQIPSQRVEPASVIKEISHTLQIDPNLKLLVVDDHPANRLLLEQQLHFLGIKQVSCPGTPYEALELLKTRHFDAIITDCFMPEIDGFTFAKQVREQSGDRIFIIGYTADARESTTIRALEAGMNCCLIKPVNINQLTEVLFNLHAQKEENNQFDIARFDTIKNTINQFSFSSKEILGEFISIMKKTNTEDLAELKRAIDAQNYPLINELTHKLTGAARIVQDKETLFICELLEDGVHSSEIAYCLQIYIDLVDSVIECNAILDQIFNLHQD